MKSQIAENEYAKRRRDNKIRWCLALLVLAIIAVAYLLYKPSTGKRALGNRKPIKKPEASADAKQGTNEIFSDIDDQDYEWETTTFDTSVWYRFSTTFGNWQELMNRPMYRAWDAYMTTSPADFDYNADEDGDADENNESGDDVLDIDTAAKEKDASSTSTLIRKIMPQNNVTKKNTTVTTDIYRLIPDEILSTTDPMTVNIKLLNNYKSPCFSYGEQEGVYCLPAFFVAGMPRCATRDLVHILSGHPHVIPSKSRSPSFWTRTQDKQVSFKQYLSHFEQQFNSLNSLPGEKGQEQVSRYEAMTYDANPSLFWKGSVTEEKGATFMTPAHLKHVLPNAKILLMVRDPVERLYSEYSRLNAYGVQDKFGEFVDKSIDSLKDCEVKTQKLYQCIHKDLADDTKPHLETGMYIVFYDEWLKHFPADQIMVIIMEDFSTNKVDWVKKICTFLGLPSLSDEEINKLGNLVDGTVEKENLKPMDAATKTKLYDFYLPFNIKFAEKVKDSRLTYPDPAKRIAGAKQK